MHETESLGMESLTRKELEAVLDELAVLGVDGSLADLRTVIAAVIEERMPDPVEMHSELMGSACLKTAFHNGDIAEAFKNAIMGHGMFSMVAFREYLETHTVVRVAADVSDDGAFVFLEISPYDCDISAFDRMYEELLCKVELSLVVLCHDKKS